MTDNTSMGDLFRQRRSAAAAGNSKTEARPAKNMSFAEIQAEQEREQASSASSGRLRGGDGGGRSSSSYGRSYSNNSGGGHHYKDSSSFGRQDSGGSYFGRQRSGGSRRRSSVDRSQFPLERGCIKSIKDHFGFIFCADREAELFFHFSDVVGGTASAEQLNVDDEVEFRVAPSANKGDKMAAYEVVPLEQGTIQWEVEDEPGERYHGIVEQVLERPRNRRGFSSEPQEAAVPEGAIRMLMEGEEAQMSSPSPSKGESEVVKESSPGEGKPEIAAVATGPLVHFTVSDYVPGGADTKSNQPGRRDGLSNNKGGGQRLCINDLVEFTMVTSSRSKKRYARNIIMILSERDRQRAIRETELMKTATLERGVVVALKRDFGYLRSNKRRSEVYFHYSNVEIPDPDDEEGNDKSGESDEPEMCDDDLIDEISGTDDFMLHEGQDMEFLVLADEKDGKERLTARRVRFLPKGSVMFHEIIAEGITGTITRCPRLSDEATAMAVGSVHLHTPIKLNEGSGDTVADVSTIAFYVKDSPYGVHRVERGRSMYSELWVREGDVLLFDVAKDTVDGSCRVFPTKHVVPSSIEETSQEDQARIRLWQLSNAGRAEGAITSVKDDYGFIALAERSVDIYFRFEDLLPQALQNELLLGNGLEVQPDSLNLCVGMEVQFDMSLQSIQPANTNNKSRGRKSHGPYFQEKLKAQRLLLLPKGSVLIEKIVASDVKAIVSKQDEKNPFTGTLALEDKFEQMSSIERHPFTARVLKRVLETGETVVYPDMIGTKDDDVVCKLAEVIGSGRLAVSHLPVSAEPSHPGRLCISRVELEQYDAAEAEAEKTAAGEDVEADTEESNTKKQKKKKKKHIDLKMIQVARYDKSSLLDLEEIPPLKGDSVTCCVVQNRRTGAIFARNLKVVERNQNPEAAAASSGIGIVTEVVAPRNFGFISLLDESATKREIVFFDFKDVLNNAAIRKGDEVKFKVRSGGSKGKRAAYNIEVCPKGTLNIPTKAHKDACYGIILMGPSHTSLSDTPDRRRVGRSRSPVRSVSPKPGTRWENVDINKKQKSPSVLKEEGLILLTQDPTGMFTADKRRHSNSPKKSESNISAASNASDSSTQTNGETKASEDVFALCSHLSYKNGAIAITGTGSSGVGDANQGPRRGDLVSFVKARSGKGVRDIRVVTRSHAMMQRGRLEGIDVGGASAIFIAATTAEEKYAVNLREVVSCDVKILKDKESVEGILHEGAIYGICRTSDLYLESKLKVNHRERPKLNLTVRRELGGQIMAQSRMAKGPDKSTGFAAGWTKRETRFMITDEGFATCMPKESEDPGKEEE